jgi:hypothetical protein
MHFANHLEKRERALGPLSRPNHRLRTTRRVDPVYVYSIRSDHPVDAVPDPSDQKVGRHCGARIR